MGAGIGVGRSAGAVARTGTSPPSAAEFRRRRAFAGEASQLRWVREWLTELLPPGEARDDVISIATELGSNAIQHTASGGPGGSFAVELTCTPLTVRVAVADGGGPGEPRVIEHLEAEHGRGLLLVRALASQTGTSGDHEGRVVWADVAWRGEEPCGSVAGNGDHRGAEVRVGDVARGVIDWKSSSRKEAGVDCSRHAADAASA